MYYFDISGDLDSGCPGSERSPSALISNVSAMTRYVRKILNFLKQFSIDFTKKKNLTFLGIFPMWRKRKNLRILNLQLSNIQM